MSLTGLTATSFASDLLQQGSELVASFRRDGFVVFPEFIKDEAVLRELLDRLLRVLKGEYDLGAPPTKAPRDAFPANFAWGPLASPQQGKPKTIHVINISKCDAAFRSLALSPFIGELVAKLMGWEACGVRFAQDQVWIKPPLCGPLTFHRDTTYFDFTPKEVATVWITFDELPDERQEAETADVSLGPLEYCAGSHRWSDARLGSANQFFHPNYRKLVEDAALREGLDPSSLQLTKVAALAGGCAVHDGRTWHGSGPNLSATAYRRGIGLHYIRGDARFCPPFGGEKLGALWAPYALPDGSLELADEHFPVVYAPVDEEGARTWTY